ncbi:MAG: 6-carboxytetrahydropterin synthase [Gemmatimonadota bacterium]|nr:6-carboxytetrahydropterin synthase [Gemmatimonadota bacterium]
MSIVTVTRRAYFSAAHRLHRDDWSEEENLRVFGDCANPNWHGHNYELIVSVEGSVDPETGFVMDLKRLKDIIQSRVVVDVDHKNLNVEVPWLSGIIPSTENLAVAVWERIAERLPEEVRLRSVVIRETPNNSVEYRGPQEDTAHE